MFTCEICGENIKYQNLLYVFQFTLGNMNSGKFNGENSNTYYYHVKCLNKFEIFKTKLSTPLIKQPKTTEKTEDIYNLLIQ